jgi:ATP-dependent Clp protease ATP-binding subunit ClpA
MRTVATPTDSNCEELSREALHREFALSSFGRVLTSKAELEKLLPVCGRDAVVRQLAHLLSSGSSVLLVGKPGSGKTAIVEKLAAWVVSGHPDLPKGFGKRQILECDHSAIQDQCLYVHEFETRFRTIIRKCQANDVILFFENVHLAASSGAVEGNEERTVATMLSIHLARERITVIGTTTPEGYQALQRRNPAFADKFVKREIAGTDAGETREALYALRSQIEVRHAVEIEDAALDEVIRVSDRFYPWKVFPGKAFEILKETVGNRLSLVNRTEAHESRRSSARLSVADVYETIERRTGLAPHFVYRDLPLRREAIVRHLEDVVFEQDEAISCLADAILTFKAELNDPAKPVAVFLFCGPSGVGKTELARQLARYLFGSEQRLLRYDMSEFPDFDGTRRFLGDGRRHNAKSFVEAVIAQPFSVVLLDEIEKAHPAIFNLLLQALDRSERQDRLPGQRHYHYDFQSGR